MLSYPFFAGHCSSTPVEGSPQRPNGWYSVWVRVSTSLQVNDRLVTTQSWSCEVIPLPGILTHTALPHTWWLPWSCVAPTSGIIRYLQMRYYRFIWLDTLSKFRNWTNGYNKKPYKSCVAYWIFVCLWGILYRKREDSGWRHTSIKIMRKGKRVSCGGSMLLFVLHSAYTTVRL